MMLCWWKGEVDQRVQMSQIDRLPLALSASQRQRSCSSLRHYADNIHPFGMIKTSLPSHSTLARKRQFGARDG